MKIVIASALFPPDVSEPAPYTKELLGRLSRDCDVSAVVYGRLPEPVENVRVIGVDKRPLGIIRLFNYTSKLWTESREANILFAINGASVELPSAFVVLLSRAKLVIYESDLNAKKGAVRKISKLLASEIIPASERGIPLPLEKPEKLPFEEMREGSIGQYEESWQKHLASLNELFKKYGQ